MKPNESDFFWHRLANYDLKCYERKIAQYTKKYIKTYNNSGNVKEKTEEYEYPITDYTMAINLN